MKVASRILPLIILILPILTSAQQVVAPVSYASKPAYPIRVYTTAIKDNGDGTATWTSYHYTLSLRAGESFTITGTGTCYDGTHTAQTIGSNGVPSSYTFQAAGCKGDYAEPYAHFSALVEKNGTVYAVHRIGYTHSGSGSLVIRSSTDGINFSTPAVLFSNQTDCDTPEGCDWGNPSISKAPNGNLIVMAAKWEVPSNGVAGAWYRISSDDGATWSAKQQLSIVPQGGVAILWTNPKLAPNAIMPDGGIGMLAAYGCTVSECPTYIIESYDNGATWTSLKLIQDASGNPLRFPSEEGVVHCGGNDPASCAASNTIVGFSRGCWTSCVAPAGQMVFFWSTDGGSSWAMATSNLAPSPVKYPPVSYNNQISPTLMDGPDANTVTLLFAERENDQGAGDYYNHIRAVTFDPLLAAAAQGTLPPSQTLWSATEGTPGFPDFGYPGAAMVGGRLSLQWGDEHYPGGPAGLFNLSTSYCGNVTGDGNFGEQAFGTTHSKVLTAVSNNAMGETLTLKLTDDDFGWDCSDNCVDPITVQVPYGAQRQIAVAFAPRSTGVKAGSVHVTSDNPNFSACDFPLGGTAIKGTPAVTWAAPVAIAYGTALGETQLNATASVPGTFVYTPAKGAVLNAGSVTLTVTFTPADQADYLPVSQTVPLTVNKAATALTTTSSPNPSTVASDLRLMATVATAAGTPTGMVTFSDGASALGAAPVASTGQAELKVAAAMNVGEHPITATYSGDGNFLASNSPVLEQTVELAPKLNVSATALSFPSALAGLDSFPLTIAVTNTGQGNLALQSINVQGPFVSQSDCPTKLLPEASCIINVIFAPKDAAPFAGTLQIVSNDAASPLAVPLSGQGTAIVLSRPVRTAKVIATGVARPGLANRTEVPGPRAAASQVGRWVRILAVPTVLPDCVTETGEAGVMSRTSPAHPKEGQGGKPAKCPFSESGTWPR